MFILVKNDWIMRLSSNGRSEPRAGAGGELSKKIIGAPVVFKVIHTQTLGT